MRSLILMSYMSHTFWYAALVAQTKFRWRQEFNARLMITIPADFSLKPVVSLAFTTAPSRQYMFVGVNKLTAHFFSDMTNLENAYRDSNSSLGRFWIIAICSPVCSLSSIATKALVLVK